MFKIAQLQGWSVKRYNYRFVCLKNQQNRNGYYENVESFGEYIHLSDGYWKTII